MGVDEGQGQTTHPISAVLADIDGTLVTREKKLTERAIQAVSRLRERGVVFTICSSRSPRALQRLVEPLHLTMPMAAFNGGVVKIVGVSDDHEKVAACEASLQKTFGTQVSAARSQPYYLDVTHPTGPRDQAAVGRRHLVRQVVALVDGRDRVEECHGHGSDVDARSARLQPRVVVERG